MRAPIVYQNMLLLAQTVEEKKPTEPLITDPTELLVFFLAFMGLIFLLSRTKQLAPLFRFVPPIVWIYFLPVVITTIGITPEESIFYDWCSAMLLPAALILLTMSTDLKAITRLGPIAIGMLLAGTVGIVLGGPLALAIFQNQLDPEIWKGLGALSGSWIGGLSNMVAIKESVDCPPNIYSPMVIIDSVVGYGWMTIVIWFSRYQNGFDKWNHANREVLDELNHRLAKYKAQNAKPITLPSFAFILMLGFVGGWLCMEAGEQIFNLLPNLGEVMKAKTWGILLVVIVGLGLSFTPVRKLEDEGASTVGYGGLYLMVATMGAQGNLNAVRETPVLFLVGVVWIGFHVLLIILAARLMKAPAFLAATGSMGNVGGVVSAPVVAGIYQPALVPVGVLLGVLGNLIGTPAGLLCAQLMSWVAEAYQ